MSHKCANHPRETFSVANWGSSNPLVPLRWPTNPGLLRIFPVLAWKFLCPAKPLKHKKAFHWTP